MNNRMNDKTFKKDDELNRKNQAFKISEIINKSNEYSRNDEGLVIALNSPWGTGKTMFLKMWENEIKKSKVESEFPLLNDKTNVLYYNAWYNDDFESALVPLIDSFNNAFKFAITKKSLDKAVKKSMKENVKKFGLLALKTTAIIGKNLIKKKLGSNIIDDFNEILDLKDNDFMEYMKIEEWFENKDLKLEDLNLEERRIEFDDEFNNSAKESYEKIKKIMNLSVSKEFETLKQLKSDFRETLKVLSSEDQKLIVFLDELDRCRPLYAIETLEVIKHFFSVPNVVFVLAVDIEQLSHSIATVYGQNMDAEGYLMRFVDLQFKLITPLTADFCRFLNKKENGEILNSELLKSIINLYDTMSLSIRDMEKIFINLKILKMNFLESEKELSDENKKAFEFYAFMIILKYKYSDIYMELMTNNMYVNRIDKNKKNLLNDVKYSNDAKCLLVEPFEQGYSDRTFKYIINDLGIQNYKGNYIFLNDDLSKEIYTNLTITQYIERQLEFVNLK